MFDNHPKIYKFCSLFQITFLRSDNVLGRTVSPAKPLDIELSQY